MTQHLREFAKKAITICSAKFWPIARRNFFKKPNFCIISTRQPPKKDNATVILQNIQNSDLLKRAGFYVYNKNHKDLFEFVDWSEATDVGLLKLVVKREDEEMIDFVFPYIGRVFALSDDDRNSLHALKANRDKKFLQDNISLGAFAPKLAKKI